MEHTPTPWKHNLGPGNKHAPFCITSPDDKVIAVVHPIGEDHERRRADAKHIVNCVNSQDALVEALKFYADPENWKIIVNGIGLEHSEMDYGQKAIEALAKTTEAV